MSGRGRVGIVAAAVAVVVAVVLAARGCGEDAADDRPAETAAAAQTAAPAAERKRPQRARATPPADAPDAPSPDAPPGEPFLVDGWPAAQVLVKRPDGRVAPGAVVYIHPAGADSPPSLDEVPRVTADSEGRVTLVAPAPGSYDVGAFEGAGFSALVTDVEFPVRGPVEIVLPETARLEIRSEGELPDTGRVTLWTAMAARVTAFPGRHESKYVGFGTDRPIPKWLDVPAGVPMRVGASGGVVVEPAVVTAPATITVRADGTRPTRFEFVFAGASPPAGLPLEYELRVAVTGGGALFEQTLSERTSGGSQIPPLLAKLPCVSGPVEVRWELCGVAMGSAVVDTSLRPEDRPFRVDVPVPDWGPCVDALRVIVSGGAAESAETVTETGPQSVPVGREARLPARGVAHVAAVGPRRGPVLVADPVAAAVWEVLDLRLGPGGNVRIAVVRPPPVSSWPITVERADGLPILMRDPPGRNQAGLFPRARIDGVTLVIGPLAAGEVELVFRIAGRESGRRTVTVRANEVVQLVAPPLVPPGPR